MHLAIALIHDNSSKSQWDSLYTMPGLLDNYIMKQAIEEMQKLQFNSGCIFELVEWNQEIWR